MANGIGALTSTMGRRSAPPRTPNAASIRSPNPGGSSPVPLNRRVARAPWRRSRNISCVAATASSSSSRRRSTTRALDPGYIKGYLPGVRENGGQYTHAAIWSVLAFAALGDGDKAGELFALLNPINHASTRAGVYRYKVEPYVVAADIYAEPPHVGRGGWTWYTGSAGGCIGPASSGFWDSGCGARFSISTPVSRARGGALKSRSAITRRATKSSSRIPQGVARGVSSVELDGAPLAGGGMHIQLADDGATHHVRVVLGAKR